MALGILLLGMFLESFYIIFLVVTPIPVWVDNFKTAQYYKHSLNTVWIILCIKCKGSGNSPFKMAVYKHSLNYNN